MKIMRVSHRKQGASGNVVGFNRPHSDQNVFHRGTIVQGSDVLTRFWCTVDIRIIQLGGE